MKHQSTRELFSYWNARRCGRRAPDRAEIEPGAIRNALADVFLLGRDSGAPFHFRLAGTRMCALFARELRGEPFLDLWDANSRAAIQQQSTLIAEDAAGIVVAARGRTNAGDSTELELLLLPLVHRGRLDLRAIGTLVPLKPPEWLEGDRIRHLTLSHFRYLESGPIAAVPQVSARHGLVVYEGGRS